jgi:Holliday junction resolvase RusA-like endonuclease
VKVSFFVPGHAAPGGSKRIVGLGTPNPRLVDMGKHNARWKRHVAKEAKRLNLCLLGPLEVEMQFIRPRPAKHYGTGKNAARLKRNAPAFPTGPPDVLKTARSTEDALNKVLWRDDSSTVDLVLSKRYGDHPGVYISVWTKERM